MVVEQLKDSIYLTWSLHDGLGSLCIWFECTLLVLLLVIIDVLIESSKELEYYVICLHYLFVLILDVHIELVDV